jgi:signal transduction histidine kinase
MSTAAARRGTVPLNVLIVEDSQDDAELMALELKRGGFAPYYQRVDGCKEMAEALERRQWDLVLSDFSMPRFSMAEALEMVRRKGLDIPFLIVSATISEEAAQDAMNAGVHDYVLKHRLGRLVPSVHRELRECEVRRERRDLEDQLRRAQKLESLGLLAGGVAHDFNNLLTGIMGNASVAMEMLGGESRVRPMLHEILRTSQRAADLTRQLLAYAGKGKFLIEPLDVSELVRDISELLRSSVPRTIELALDLDGKLPPVEGDSSQLQQLVMNLILNAVEAAGVQPGTVRVSTSVRQVRPANRPGGFRPDAPVPGVYVQVEVRDDGCGMNEATKAQIFDPFFTTKFTGRGLGLAAALGIVRGHKGSIAVSSSEGNGSTFTVLLPALQVEAGSHAPTSGAGSQPVARSQGGSVLVIDDEDIVRRSARTMLEHFGYSVFEAANGQDGTDLFSRLHDRISCVLLDLTMPRMDGPEVWRYIRRIRPDMRIVISSGFDETEARKQFGDAQGLDFIQKPYTATALARKVAAAMERRPKG